MSPAAQFVIECERRGVAILREKNQVVLRGKSADVDALHPALVAHVDAVMRLITAWLNAPRPALHREMH